MTNQSAASIVRQILALLAVVFGVLTASVASLHLPASVSAVLVVAGAVVIALEHYLADPSTGNHPPPAAVVVTTGTATPVTAVPAAAVAATPSAATAAPTPVVIHVAPASDPTAPGAAQSLP